MGHTLQYLCIFSKNILRESIICFDIGHCSGTHYFYKSDFFRSDLLYHSYVLPESDALRTLLLELLR